MSYIKKELEKYTKLLNKVKNSLSTFEFESTEEKADLISLLERHVHELWESYSYIDDWDILEKGQFRDDWKDIRL